MSGRCRPSLRYKTLWNVDLSSLSKTDKECIHGVFELAEHQKAKIEALQMDNAQLHSDIINANMNLEHMTAEIERLNRDYSTAVETMSNSIRTANADKEALIAGQETLQKALAEKNAEIEGLLFSVQSLSGHLSSARAEAIKEFASAYKDQIKNYTGMFTDEGFYVSHEAVLSAVDFVLNRMAGDTE